MVSFFKRKDGKHCAKWKSPDGQYRYIYRSTEAAVKEAYEQTIQDEDVPVPRNSMTVVHLLDEWLDGLHGTVSRRTYLNRESLVRIHLRPTLGGVRIDQVCGDDVRGLLRRKLDAGLAPGTVKRLYGVLKTVLPSEAMRGVKPPHVQQDEMHVLSKAQVMRLLDTVRGDRFEVAYVLGALCGLRIGECLALRWDDVDFEQGCLRVQRTVWRVEGQGIPAQDGEQ